MALGLDFPSEMLNAILCLLRQPDLFRAVGTCTDSGEMSHAYKQQLFRTLQDHLPVVWHPKVKIEKQCFECLGDALRLPARVLEFLALALELSDTCLPWLLFDGDAPKLVVLKLDVVPASESEVISTVTTLELDWDCDCGDGPSTRTLPLIKHCFLSPA
ncbi:hypothetical protein EXIGLDRAFT_771394 [Exidia glandulosa HHB12029]|uniref:Uncharacterized protein n=1 Tax=Exidia glandulosa HHB12029 TaxID=1314781 RepID=A0A165G0A9_EXIGL|nr:hypothetical protein EXIGLDRAFT_771394 [Exidia glandulosa HHB12029]